MKYASMPWIAGMLSGCGDGSSDDPLVSEDTDVTLDPGVDPTTLKHTPEGIALDIDYLRQTTSQKVRCSVAVGEVMIPNAHVTFFDVTGEVIGEAITNEKGLAETDINARRMVAAEVTTEYGMLYGMRFYVGHEYQPVIYVDILQSIFVSVAKSIKEQLNVSAFLIQDYFALPYDLNIFNIGHSYPAIDQRLMAEDYISSGKTINDYINDFTKKIISKTHNDVYEDLRFNANIKNHKNKSLNINSTASIERDDFEFMTSIVASAFGDAIKFPFLSDLLNFGFGKLSDKFFPDKNGPFVDIAERLDSIEIKLDNLAEAYAANEWVETRKKVHDKFLNIQYLLKLQKEVRNHIINYPNDSEYHTTDEYKGYINALLNLSDKNIGKQISDWEESRINSAIDYLLGNNVSSGAIPIDTLFNILRAKKFYSLPSENIYKGYLSYLTYYVSMGYMLIATSSINRAISENKTEYQITEELKRLLNRYLEVIQKIKAIDVERLPERVNIDYKNKLAWIGSCGLVKTVNDFWPPNRQECSDLTIVVKMSDRPYKAYSCNLKEYGRGLDGWKGPTPQREMERDDAHVSLETRNFAGNNWRSATKDEFKEAFMKGIKKETTIAAHAATQGFSCVLHGTEVNLNPFNNYPYPGDLYSHHSLPSGSYPDGPAKIPTSYKRSGPDGKSGKFYYIDCTCFDTSNKSSHSRNVRNNYGDDGDTLEYNPNPSRYIFFPTCDVNDELLARYIPWIKLKRP